MTREFMDAFAVQNGSYFCRDLLSGCELTSEEGQRQFKERGLLEKSADVRAERRGDYFRRCVKRREYIPSSVADCVNLYTTDDRNPFRARGYQRQESV